MCPAMTGWAPTNSPLTANRAAIVSISSAATCSIPEPLWIFTSGHQPAEHLHDTRPVLGMRDAAPDIPAGQDSYVVLPP